MSGLTLEEVVPALKPERHVEYRDQRDRRAARASPASLVPSLPPISRVISPAAIVSSIPRSMADAASTKAGADRLRPSQAKRSAAERISENGLAMFFPAMSGAEPCEACAMA